VGPDSSGPCTETSKIYKCDHAPKRMTSLEASTVLTHSKSLFVWHELKIVIKVSGTSPNVQTGTSSVSSNKVMSTD
jgi:hypothetical protein